MNPPRNGPPPGARIGIRAITRFVRGSMRMSVVGARRTPRIAQIEPSPAARLTSLPTGIRAVTRRVRGSTRRMFPLFVSDSHTEPNATAVLRPEGIGDRDVRDDPRAGVGRGRLGVRRRDHPQAEHEHQAHGQGGGERADGERRARPHGGRGAREPAAVLLAERRLAELEAQAGGEVVGHPWPPIRWRTMRRRTVCSPRLTRLRTTASEVPSSPAMSP